MVSWAHTFCIHVITTNPVQGALYEQGVNDRQKDDDDKSFGANSFFFWQASIFRETATTASSRRTPATLISPKWKFSFENFNLWRTVMRGVAQHGRGGGGVGGGGGSDLSKARCRG